MGTEIERKFLVAELPGTEALGTGLALRQGYLARESTVEVRIRITEQGATLTLKAGRGLSRTEVEVDLELDAAEALWAHTEGQRIEKVRHRVPVGDHIAEVDLYAGRLDGLVTAEVEFTSPEDASAFDPPAWLGRELTGDDRWSNASLSVHGLPR